MAGQQARILQARQGGAVFVDGATTIEQAGHCMKDNDINALFVRDGQRVGVVTGMNVSKAVVLQRQQRYREDLFGTATNRSQAIISSRPAAVYALRSYLRLCMPMTIETEINNTVTTFERGGAAALQISRPMISAKSVGATVIRDATAGPATRIKTAVVFEDAGNLLRTWLRPNGAVDRERVAVIEKFIAEKKYDPPPQVTTFLRGAAFTDGRVELARRLGLIR